MPRRRFEARRTRIICTIGPATASAAMVEQLVRAGMNVARLNLSHGTRQEHARTAAMVREVSARQGAPVSLLVDLPGPKYRTGRIAGGQVTLRRGRHLVLTTRDVPGDETAVSVSPPTLPRDVSVGAPVLLGDGALRLRVVSKTETDVDCRVLVGGVLSGGRGLVVPGMRACGPFLTEQLRGLIAFALTLEPDYLAVSFVGCAQDMVDVAAVVQEYGRSVPLVAKIERGEAVRNFRKILDVSQAVMVARGDLGTDIPLERVPTVQRDIIRQCNQAGKPVITATEMLESMVSRPRPTRAEVTDVASAIIDGSDAVMLSAETAVGRYPVQAVRIMGRIACETERHLSYERMLAEREGWLQRQTDELISYDAVQTAHYLGAVAIVAFTKSGSTAQRVSKYRPRVPVLALTPDRKVLGRILLCWGICPILVGETETLDELFAEGARLAAELGLARSGDLIVITGGVPIGQAGSTNLLRVLTLP